MTDGASLTVRSFDVVAPNFFFIPLKAMTVEEDAVADRVYFIHDGKVVAVGFRKERRP